MIKRLLERDWLVFALAFTWKTGLLIFTAQPIPTGDQYFYDGAVVHALNGGNYANPSLAVVLPIAGKEVFSAYPPLHQASLYLDEALGMWFQTVEDEIQGERLITWWFSCVIGSEHLFDLQVAIT